MSNSDSNSNSFRKDGVYVQLGFNSWKNDFHETEACWYNLMRFTDDNKMLALGATYRPFFQCKEDGTINNNYFGTSKRSLTIALKSTFDIDVLDCMSYGDFIRCNTPSDVLKNVDKFYKVTVDQVSNFGGERLSILNDVSSVTDIDFEDGDLKEPILYAVFNYEKTNHQRDIYYDTSRDIYFVDGYPVVFVPYKCKTKDLCSNGNLEMIVDWYEKFKDRIPKDVYRGKYSRKNIMALSKF